MAFPSTDSGNRLLIQQALASAITSEDQMYCAAAQTATGTNQATALPISSKVAFVEFSTTASGTGAMLPPSDPGDRYYIANNGANTLTVYTGLYEPAASPKINGTAGTTGVTQAAGTNAVYVCMTAGQFYRISGT